MPRRFKQVNRRSIEASRHAARVPALTPAQQAFYAAIEHYWPIVNEIVLEQEKLRDPWRSAFKAINEAHVAVLAEKGGA